MNIVYFTGNVGKDAEVRTVKGSDVCNFSVAVKQGFGRDAKSEWYRVAIWGQRASSLAPYILKGQKVAVCGDLEIGSYDGKPQYNVRAHEVDPFMGGKKQGDGGAAHEPASTWDQTADLDDDVPF